MKKESNTFCRSLKSKLDPVMNGCRTFRVSGLNAIFLLLLSLSACDVLKDKSGDQEEFRTPVARVNNAYLYKDELVGIVSPGTSAEDSTVRVESYLNAWIRKQLLIQEAAKKIDINEAEVERKILDYRYSIIAYEYQNFYINQNLDTVIADSEVETYYKDHIDNFILKQNIVQATFIKVPKNAPKIDRIKDLVVNARNNSKQELKSYCLSFSSAYHIADSTWMIFDDLVQNSSLAEIPNKIQFLKTNPYYETSDENFLYFFKADQYRISDNVSPMEFVKDEIRNIILNKRKIELAKKLEEEVYNQGVEQDAVEIIK